MMVLEELPDELIDAICQQLILVAGNHELINVMTVNKRFYSIAHPLRWRDVHVPERCYLHRMFCAFIVLQAPRLAPLVKTIRIDAMGTRAYEDDDEGLRKKKALRDESVLSSLADRTDEIFAGNDDKRVLWHEKVWEQNTDYLIPLILVHLPNLKSLRMTSCTVDMEESELWSNTGDIVAHMLADGQLAENQKPFQKLREVWIDGPFAKHGVYSSPLATVAAWPMVESVRAVHTVDEIESYKHSDFTQLVPRSSNLSTVNLYPNCKLAGEHLQYYLATACNLRTFRYHMGRTWVWIDFRTRDLQKALNPHKGTLEDIALCIDPWEYELDESLQLHPPMDFRAFDKLVHLCVGLPFLFDRRMEPPGHCTLADALPPCLRHLRIVQVEQAAEMQWVESNMRELVKRKKEQMLPDLFTVQISSSVDSELSEGAMGRAQHDLARTRLTNLFRGSGVTIRVFLHESDPFRCYTRWGLAPGLGLYENEVANDGSHFSPESSGDETVEDSDFDGDGDSEEEVVGLATILDI